MLISFKSMADWVTTGATIFTFFAIAWQSYETRKAADFGRRSAEAALRQAEIANKTLIAQFCPRVIVRDIRLLQESADLKICIHFENLGATNATVKRAEFQIGWKFLKDSYDPFLQESIDEFPLDAGGEFKSVTTIPGLRSKLSVFQIALGEGNPGKYSMQIIGTIRYKDGSGMYKKTGFCRNLDIKTQRFRPVPDSEDEYQD